MTLPDGRTVNRLSLPANHPLSWPSLYLAQTGRPIESDLGSEWWNHLPNQGQNLIAHPGEMICYALEFLLGDPPDDWDRLTGEEVISALASISTDHPDDWLLVLRLAYQAIVRRDNQTSLAERLDENPEQVERVRQWLLGFPDPPEEE